MKEFLKETLIEPFSDNDWTEWVFGIIAWFTTIVLLVVFIWGSIWLIDSSFLPTNEENGVVTGKYEIPAHSTTTYVMSGKVLIPITTFYKTQYEIEITIDELTDDLSLKEEFWNELKVGQTLCCKYTKGRILKSIYIKSLCNVYGNKQ